MSNFAFGFIGSVAAIAPPVFVASTTAFRNGGNTGNVTITKPTGVVNGDTIYATVESTSTSSTAATITGFSQVYFDNSAQPVITILKKTASSEGSSYSVVSTVSSGLVVTMLAYRGGVGSEDVVGTITRPASSTTTTASSITALSSGVLLAIYMISTLGSARTVSTPPSGMTERISYLGVSPGSTVVYELTPSPAGSTGSKSVVWDGSTPNTGAILMQIK